MSELLTTWSGAALVVLRTVAVYLFILVGLRLAGKREIGQMTPFDLALLLLLSNSVQNAMVGPDNSLLGGLVAAAVLLTLNAPSKKRGSRIKWWLTSCTVPSQSVPPRSAFRAVSSI